MRTNLARAYREFSFQSEKVPPVDAPA